jgi:Rrf2 family protein
MAATSRFAVAVHAAAVLAYRGARGDAWVSSERVAESVGTNPVVVRRVLAALARAGLVETRLGAEGGARLTRRPEDIALVDVYRAVEGEGAVLAHNANPPNPRCVVSCGMRRALAPVFAPSTTRSTRRSAPRRSPACSRASDARPPRPSRGRKCNETCFTYPEEPVMTAPNVSTSTATATERPHPIPDAAAHGGSTPRRRLAGKAALVTGGNSGIGLAAAEALLREGARVAITGRDTRTLSEAAAHLEAVGRTQGAPAGAVLTAVADVTRGADLDRVMAAVGGAFGPLDVLFVNAGVGEFAPVDQATEAHYDRIFDANVKGAYFTVQKALPLLGRGASVILNGSINGLIGMPAPASTRRARRRCARSPARSRRPQGPRRARQRDQPRADHHAVHRAHGAAARAVDGVRAGIAAQVPLGRFGEPREIADAVVFLASDESTFFVGAELVADGGMSQL